MADVTSGDCFVVAASDGRCWGGDRWVALWSAARQFRRPDPAYELCVQEAREAQRRTGVAGVVCYIPCGTPATMHLAPFTDYSQVDLREMSPSSRRPGLKGC